MQGANLRAGSANQAQRCISRQTTRPAFAARRVQRSKLVCQASTASDKFPAKVCIVLGTQWGDEGKGKLVDILAQQYDVIARAQVRSLARRASGMLKILSTTCIPMSFIAAACRPCGSTFEACVLHELQ